MRNILYVLLFALAVSGCGGSAVPEYYRADSPAVRYVGRTLVSGDGSVSFDWSGTYLSVGFTGGYCAMKASDTGKNYYNVFIDGEFKDIAVVSGTDTLVVLAEGLTKGEHMLTLQKRTEGEQGKTTIHGFQLAGGGCFIAPPEPEAPKRHIEFIGNSLTCGYGTEGKSKDERFRPDTENCDLAFGCIIARYFGADYTLIAHSGRGVVRNYGDSLTTSQNTMKERMLRTFDEQAEPLWDFRAGSYKPDIVVINLGTNDFSTRPHPSKEEFTGAYMQILAQLRDVYDDIPILCVGPRLGEPVSGYVRDAHETAGDDNLYYAALLPGTYGGDGDLGSDSHPNHNGQIKMAMALIPHISTATGWELTDKVIK